MKQHKLLPDLTFPEPLPKTVIVEGKPYPIRWDFTAAVRFMDYVDQSEDEDEIFIKNVLSIWYPRIPENTDEALTQAIKFYCGGDLPGEGYYTPAFPPAEDHAGLYAEFWEIFGLDLTRDPIHWWVFRRLLNCLKERRKTP